MTVSLLLEMTVLQRWRVWSAALRDRPDCRAEKLHMAAIPRRIQFGFLHASGEQLIREGIDDGSRRQASALLGPACGVTLKPTIFEFATMHSPDFTIDFFAAAGNTIVKRFAAWTAEPGAELVHAFSSQSWNHGMCVCGRRHRDDIEALMMELMMLGLGADWWLNVQSGLHDPGNNTPGILQSA